MHYNKKMWNMRSLNEDDVDKALWFLENAFIRSEPLCVVLGITGDEFTACFKDIIRECCKCGLSVGIFEVDDFDNTGDIVSIALALPESLHFDWGQKHNNIEKMEPLLEILGMVNVANGNNKAYELDGVYLFIICTDEKVMNKGHMRNAIRLTHELAKDAGYKRITADATNKVSQHVLYKCFNYEEHGPFVYYNAFEYKGKKWFEGVANGEYIVRMRRVL